MSSIVSANASPSRYVSERFSHRRCWKYAMMSPVLTTESAIVPANACSYVNSKNSTSKRTKLITAASKSAR